MAELKISQMTQATEEQLTDGALMEVAVEDSNSSTGYSTKSGSLARLKDYAIGEVADELLANQNGGYARKNLLNPNQATATANGGTLTNNGDGTYTINGTFTAQQTWNFTNPNMELPAGKYIVSGITGGSASTYKMVVNKLRAGGTYQTIVNDLYTGDREIDLTSDYGGAIRVYIQCQSGYVASNLSVQPMVRPATIEDGTYVPYAPSNVDLANSVSLKTVDISSMITMNEAFTLSEARAYIYGGRLCQLYIYARSANALTAGTEYTVGTLATALRPIVLCAAGSSDLNGAILGSGSLRARPITAKAANSAIYLCATFILASEYAT